MAVLGLKSTSHWIIFILYVVVSINQSMLTTASQDGNRYKYNATFAVLVTAVLKLCTACISYIFWEKHTLQNLILEVSSHRKVMMLYSVPAFLYSMCDNLTYINLSLHDPTTFIILLQLRIVLSAVIYQMLFKKRLSCLQWMSLLVLTLGCIIKHVDFSNVVGVDSWWYGFPLTVGLFYMLLQSFMSLFAGVYTEYLLKGEQEDVNLWIQNIYMYSSSILWSVIFSVLRSNFLSGQYWDSSETILQPKVIVILLNSSVHGIVTSIFLKNLNSIVKSFALAIVMILMPIITNLLFGITISFPTLLAIVLIILAIQIYSRNPVTNRLSLPSQARKGNV